MIQSITRERWSEAQLAERALHTFEYERGRDHYDQAYAKMFKYLGMDRNQEGKSVLEVGPADFPALAYCRNYKGIIVEPMSSDYLPTLCRFCGIELLTQPLEDLELSRMDEVWIFNVMQHVIDPEVFIDKCKSIGRMIRFFEPVDCGTCEYHPHTFTQEDFERWFGDSVRRYTDRLEGFFDGDCVYGTFQCA